MSSLSFPTDRLAIASATLLVGLLTACSSDTPAPLAPETAARAVVVPPAPADTWRIVYTGATGPGSLYRIYVPIAWNGDLVTIAHPIRDAFAPVTLTNEGYMNTLRDILGARGFAIAYSSYSRNGFAVKDGAQRTHQLRGLAIAQLGAPPRHHYLVGFSLGSAVSLSLIEQFPTQYDGALLACGMVGGSLVETQYLGHVRTLFDVAYPGILSGNTLGVPVNYMPNAAAIQGAILANPTGLYAIASMAQTPLPYQMSAAQFPNLIESLISALTFHARGINDISGLVAGKSPFGNMTEQYTVGALVPVLLPPPMNAFAPLVPMLASTFDTTVSRYAMAPSARNYLEQYYTPTGKLQRPVLTVHNRWDPIVPAFHEDTLHTIVQQAGRTAFLSQRLVNAYGHCAQMPFTAVLQGFNDLESWVTTGIKP